MDVRIYVEGGGEGGSGRAILRSGFEVFFFSLRELARSKKAKCHIIPCGSRDSALHDFRLALKHHPNDFNILLVDAEDLVMKPPLDHLRQRDQWDMKGIDEQQCHLMVTMMESWFLADLEALHRFYGDGFSAKPLPKRSNIEENPKADVESGIQQATRGSKKKKYHKMNHGPSLLKAINPTKVRKAAPHCERLFQTVEQIFNA